MTETNRTPYRQTYIAKSLEVLNDLGHIICDCNIEANPKSINIGNAAHISKALNEHAALVAVAEAAQRLIDECGSLPFMKYRGGHYEEWCAAKEAINNLAAVRAGNGGSK